MKIDTVATKRVAERIGRLVEILESHRRERAQLEAGKLEVLVDLGKRRLPITSPTGFGGNYHTVRGMEMFNLAVRKLLAGQIHDIEVELVGLRGKLDLAMRGGA